jgi:hypothetical protein
MIGISCESSLLFRAGFLKLRSEDFDKKIYEMMLKSKQICEKERYKIEALYEQGLTARQIGDALTPRRDRRTIERELQLGLVEQKRLNPSDKKYEPLHFPGT